ncbi:hypothetical protein MTO96_041765 [Rhipicephalus appendiculatus]
MERKRAARSISPTRPRVRSPRCPTGTARSYSPVEIPAGGDEQLASVERGDAGVQTASPPPPPSAPLDPRLLRHCFTIGRGGRRDAIDGNDAWRALGGVAPPFFEKEPPTDGPPVHSRASAATGRRLQRPRCRRPRGFKHRRARSARNFRVP